MAILRPSCFLVTEMATRCWLPLTFRISPFRDDIIVKLKPCMPSTSLNVARPQSCGLKYVFNKRGGVSPEQSTALLCPASAFFWLTNTHQPVPLPTIAHNAIVRKKSEARSIIAEQALLREESWCRRPRELTAFRILLSRVRMRFILRLKVVDFENGGVGYKT